VSLRFIFVIFSAALLASTGCSRGPALAAQIQSAGGEIALKRECQNISVNVRSRFNSAFYPLCGRTLAMPLPDAITRFWLATSIRPG